MQAIMNDGGWQRGWVSLGQPHRTRPTSSSNGSARLWVQIGLQREDSDHQAAGILKIRPWWWFYLVARALERATGQYKQASIKFEPTLDFLCILWILDRGHSPLRPAACMAGPASLTAPPQVGQPEPGGRLQGETALLADTQTLFKSYCYEKNCVVNITSFSF